MSSLKRIKTRLRIIETDRGGDSLFAARRRSPDVYRRRDAEGTRAGPFEPDYSFVAGVLIEYAYHLFSLWAYCPTVWYAMKLASVFADTADAPAGPIHDVTSSE